MYTVSYRVGTDMLSPDICFTRREANAKAYDFLAEAAKAAWDRTESGKAPEDPVMLMEWADEKGYVYTDSFFWDGSSDASEVLITDHGDQGFLVRVEDGNVYINGQFESQLCWTNDAVGCAVAIWLNEGGESRD